VKARLFKGLCFYFVKCIYFIVYPNYIDLFCPVADRKPEVEWKGDPDKDMTGKCCDYTLRAQDMGAYVWWAVFDKDLDQVSFGNRKNMRSAKVTALFAMKRHNSNR
jgi:hypothetical protein